MSLRIVGTVYVDHHTPVVGELRVEQEHIDISTRGPKVDPDWFYVDGFGHFHACSTSTDGPQYPTLVERSRPVECDGSCGGVCGGEGFDVTEFFCRICDEPIHPGMIPGPHYGTTPGRSTWTVVAQAYLAATGPHDQRYSVRVETKQGTWFGVAVLTDSELGFDGAGRTTYIGVTALGRRKSMAEVRRG